MSDVIEVYDISTEAIEIITQGPQGPPGDGTLGYYGAFSDYTSQTITSVTAAYAMTLNTTDESSGVSRGTPTSRIVFANAGTYNVQWSGQFQNSNNNDHDARIWLKKNGTDLAGTTGLISVPSSHGQINGHIIAGWNFILTLAAGDYLEFYWSAESTAVSIQTYSAGTNPTTPSTASLIVTAQQVMNLQVGPTGPAGADGQGVPTGGTIGQVLRKASAADYDTEWGTGGGGSGTVTSVALAGTGLSISGSPITASGTITANVVYGTTAGTACEGNDGRISGIQSGSIVISGSTIVANSEGFKFTGADPILGAIDVSDNGGGILTYSDGGTINTSSGGGSIDTRGTGSIELGVAGTRTTLTGTATADRAISLPDAAGTLALTTTPPASHAHGNITNAGAIGSTANLPLITTTSGVVTTGAFGTGATDFAAGNHTHTASAISDSTTAGRALLTAADASAQRTSLGLGTLATQSGTFSGTSSGTNTGDQTITITGDVTGSGTGSFAATIASNAVTNVKLAQVATSTLKGRATAATGNVEDLTAAQARGVLGLATTDNATFGSIQNTPIGSTTAAAGTFTTLTASTSLAITGGIITGASNVIEQVNSTSGQTFRLYNTQSGTGGVNFERLRFAWSSNVAIIGTEKGGTGIVRTLEFQTDGVTRLSFTTGGNTQLTSGATLVFATIGRIIPGGTDGVIRISNIGDNGFDRLQFGGTTSSFPALKRSSTALQVRLADDSAYSVIDAQIRAQGTAPATSGATGTAGDIRYDADYIYICTATNTWKRAAIATW